MFVDGDVVGTLTSGNYSPVLGRGIGMGLLEPGLAPGQPVAVVLRGREIEADGDGAALRAKGEVVADYLPHTPDEIDEMLAFLGMDSLDELFAHIPPAVRLARGLDIDPRA